QRSDPADWDTVSVKTIKENMSSNVSGIPLKYAYGSSFPYQETDKYIPFEAKGVQTSASLAKGGFSNVWGSAVLPYIDSDLIDWPILEKDLAPHYRQVLSFMDFAGSADGLTQLFPLHANKDTGLKASNQAASLLSDMERNRSELKARGISFGKSRLAV